MTDGWAGRLVTYWRGVRSDDTILLWTVAKLLIAHADVSDSAACVEKAHIYLRVRQQIGQH